MKRKTVEEIENKHKRFKSIEVEDLEVTIPVEEEPEIKKYIAYLSTCIRYFIITNIPIYNYLYPIKENTNECYLVKDPKQFKDYKFYMDNTKEYFKYHKKADRCRFKILIYAEGKRINRVKYLTKKLIKYTEKSKKEYTILLKFWLIKQIIFFRE